jgi:peptidoglycan hydrolase-like protein with peptidoglycan-binding domain
MWVAAPLGAYWFLTERANDESLEAPVAVDDVVRLNTGSTTREVGLLLAWRVPGGLAAPEWAGVVQAVSLAPDKTVSSGDVVAKVAGVDRLACASSYPLAGPMGSGDKGQDVATLHECLTLFGYDLARDNGVYGNATRAAVADLSAKTGAASDKGAAFDPGWLVFLPEEAYRPQTVDLAVGTPAPAAGTVIAETGPVLTGAMLAPAESLESVAGEELTAYSGGSDETGAVVGPDSSEVDGTVAGAEERLQVRGVEIALAESRAEVAPEALATLGDLVEPGSAAAEGALERPAGADELMVAAASVVTEPDGSVCVLRVNGDTLEPVPVEILGSEIGSSIIKGQLKAGDQIRVAPAARDRRC